MSDLGNHAFIDSQNLHLGVKKLGWDLDYRKFRKYLRAKYFVKKAYFFIGYVETNRELYDQLERAGYKLIFKPVIRDRSGKVKGNIDADLVLHVMINLNNFQEAVIVTSDGDFSSLIKHLLEEKKLCAVISPDEENCSILLKNSAGNRHQYLKELRNTLEYK